MTNTELAALAQQAVAEGKPIAKIPSGRRSRGRIETDDRQYETPVFEPTAPQPNPYTFRAGLQILGSVREAQNRRPPFSQPPR